MNTKTYNNHYEMTVTIHANAEEVFAYADDHRNLSAHMNKSSWMMGGGKMETHVDGGKGQKVGSHITMRGTVFGIKLFLDEVVVQHNSPLQKAWETVDNVNLIVIDHYRLGFIITPHAKASTLKVYIDYNLPKSWKTTLLGYLFGGMYAKWCVAQMANVVQRHFQI